MSEKLTMTRYFEARRELIFADRPADITRLEKLIEETQADVVNDFIEKFVLEPRPPRFCWRSRNTSRAPPCIARRVSRQLPDPRHRLIFRKTPYAPIFQNSALCGKAL